jgi:MYXO-CTERM domain-containing protein
MFKIHYSIFSFMEGCHGEPVEPWWAGLCARVFDRRPFSSPRRLLKGTLRLPIHSAGSSARAPLRRQNYSPRVIARYEAIPILYRTDYAYLTCLGRDCFVPRNDTRKERSIFILCSSSPDPGFGPAGFLHVALLLFAARARRTPRVQYGCRWLRRKPG